MILSGIYRIKNTVTGEAYVGSSNNIDKRWKHHVWLLNKNKHTNAILQRIYNKHGKDIFKFEILEICPVDLLMQREQERLDSKAYIYNICDSAAAPMLGKIFTEEHKAKISAAAKGHSRCLGQKRTAEQKAHMSAVATGKPGTNIGKKFSAEHKEKMVAGMKAAWARRKAAK